jgi:hypothetical protein
MEPLSKVIENHDAHLSTLLSVRTRVLDLHMQHAVHIQSYQQPLLSELGQLRDSFLTLQAGHKAILENEDVIQARLEQVTAQAKELAGVQSIASVGEMDIIKAIAGVTAAVAEAEEKGET